MSHNVKISNTGYWESNTQLYHVCCTSLCDWIADYFQNEKDKQIYDFGCGLGQYCQRLSERGFTKLQGFEGAPHAYNVFPNIKQQDLTIPFSLKEKGNVIFLEVAEHIPAQFENVMLNNIADACDDKLVMSWAVRGQAGWGHVNCLNNDEAIARVTAKGFIYLADETSQARSRIPNNDPCPWFKNTTLVFKKV